MFLFLFLFFVFVLFLFFAFHFQETTETFLKGVYQNGNFYREKPKISPGKSDFAPPPWKIFLLRHYIDCIQHNLYRKIWSRQTVMFYHGLDQCDVRLIVYPLFWPDRPVMKVSKTCLLSWYSWLCKINFYSFEFVWFGDLKTKIATICLFV